MTNAPLDPTQRDLRATADALRAAAASAGRVLLTGPTGPDGDSIGACLALASALRRLGDTPVDVAGVASYRYSWMPGADRMIADRDVKPQYDLVIVLDGDATRLEPQVAAAFDAARVKAIVDHHRSTRPDAYDVAFIDHDAASTCDLVYLLMQAWGLDLDHATAQLVYAGVIFDTGGFRHSNTTPGTHRLAAELLGHDIDHDVIFTRILSERSKAGLRLLGQVVADARFLADDRVVVGVAPYALGTRLGAGPGDLEGIVDHLLYTSGVELACFFIERAPGQVKLSLRSRSDIDVAALAGRIDPGGGGHARAAGALLRDSLDNVLAHVQPMLVEAAGPSPANDAGEAAGDAAVAAAPNG